ncbi:winged helix-turn-helix domain-containing protein [Marinobacter arenosus]|uniref:winged helix-turn-helix domain-containing protein n=1 Tax=Marinobacter arenosus TaxID=2856822 RepID=UPI001C4C93E5|nr:winged helix-turn-helix domain-containing protein [Marinobacter arenosus]MBW0148036.1 winged helix-turn-helix domain-containing protein [Marinobacter arenosus]
MRLAFGDYELDTDLFELRCAGELRSLEPQVFDLLAYLVRHRDRIVSRQELLDELWAGKIVTESTLSSRIKAVRQALGDNGREQQRIATYNRRGYRFVAQTQESPPPLSEREALLRDNALAGSEALGSACLFPQFKGQSHDRPVLAVLPFSHSQGSDEVAWIADVLGEDIGIQLARIPGFMVLSRNTSAYYRLREISIDEIGRELGADYVIEGSVWARGENLRVGLQLQEIASGRLLWSERRVIPADQLAELQEELVCEIVGCIEPELNRAELETLRRRRTVDLGAWALYRQAHATLGMKGWSEESFTEAADLLRQAIAQDPELAFAHAYLALILAIGHLVGLVHGGDWKREATEAAETAVALDSQDSDVLGYAGCAFADMGDYQRGIDMLRRAVEIDPSNAQALAALGAALLQTGEEGGIDYMLHGIRISPRDNRLAAWGALLARGMINYGRLDEAIATAAAACRCDDKIFLPRVVLAIAQIVAGNQAAAALALGDARRIRPGLSIKDIARFASTDEIGLLQRADLL